VWWRRLECGLDTNAPCVDGAVTLKRVGPRLAGALWTLVFEINGAVQHVVKDEAGDEEFESPMADPAAPAASLAAPTDAGHREQGTGGGGRGDF
jgi:hypothetical protein